MRLNIVACLLIFTLVNSTKIDPKLKESLKTKNGVNILVSFKTGTQSTLQAISQMAHTSRTERSTAVYNSLTALAKKSQASLLQFLTQAKIPAKNVQSFWITNQVAIEGATLEFIRQLSQLEDVSKIEEEEIVHQDQPILESTAEKVYRDPSILAEWGVDIIQAPSVWQMAGGSNGAGITVANVDSGVRYTHVILAANYKNDGRSWYDPYDRSQVAHDRNGHGTHTMGTIAGANGYGVAPGSRWITCKGLRDDNSGTSTSLIACGQFMVCPTDPNGNDADCSKTPHIVSSSWGANDGGGSEWYNGVISAWHAAGIIPTFSNGNTGPSCSSAGSPADQNVIGVGATTSADGLATFSSVGPSFYGSLKPDISAPGQSIISSYYTSDTAYASYSGTSMACPHVAGVIALLLSKNPNLSYANVKSILQSNTDKNLLFSGATCGGVVDNQFPNNHFGHGRLNAYKAYTAVVN